MTITSIREAQDIFVAMFNKWNESLTESYARIEALKKMDPHAHGFVLLNAVAPTAACYSRRAVLWPTMGDGPCTSPDAIKDYFAHFAAKNPKGTLDGAPMIEADDIDHDDYGDPKITVHGKYTFSMNDPKTGTRVEVHCRYGFKVIQEFGEWKWSHHNSDVLPSSQLEVKMTPVRQQNNQAGRKPDGYSPR